MKIGKAIAVLVCLGVISVCVIKVMRDLNKPAETTPWTAPPRIDPGIRQRAADIRERAAKAKEKRAKAVQAPADWTGIQVRRVECTNEKDLRRYRPSVGRFQCFALDGDRILILQVSNAALHLTALPLAGGRRVWVGDAVAAHNKTLKPWADLEPTMAVDGGNIYVATRGRGLVRFANGKATTWSEANGLPTNSLAAVAAVEGRVFMGSSPPDKSEAGGGIYELQPATSKFTTLGAALRPNASGPLDGDPGYIVAAILGDAKRRCLWAYLRHPLFKDRQRTSQRHGLWRYDLPTGKWEKMGIGNRMNPYLMWWGDDLAMTNGQRASKLSEYQHLLFDPDTRRADSQPINFPHLPQKAAKLMSLPDGRVASLYEMMLFAHRPGAAFFGDAGGNVLLFRTPPKDAKPGGGWQQVAATAPVKPPKSPPDGPFPLGEGPIDFRSPYFRQMTKPRLTALRARADKAIAKEPKRGELYVSRADMRHFLGDRAGALADLEQALALNPDLADAYYNRACYHAWAKKFQLALADFVAAERVGHDRINPVLMQAAILARTERPKEALALYEKVLTLHPQHGKALEGRRLCRVQLGLEKVKP